MQHVCLHSVLCPELVCAWSVAGRAGMELGRINLHSALLLPLSAMVQDDIMLIKWLQRRSSLLAEDVGEGGGVSK